MQWPECDEKDGDVTQSLMAIVTGAYQKWVLKGEPSVLLPMLQVPSFNCYDQLILLREIAQGCAMHGMLTPN